MDKKIYNIGIDDQTIDDSIELYGRNMQSMVCMEECAELAQAISKCVRYNTETRMDNLKEEIADVLICTVMVSKINGIDWEDIQKEIDRKQTRCRQRINDTI